jgi:hypothetical protein
MGDKIRTVGSRAQVWHGTALHTSGRLHKADLIKNKHGRIVSKKKSASEKKLGRLKCFGYTHKKGTFGSVRMDTAAIRPKKSKTLKKH